jgi:hypothetical protein
MNRDAVDMKPAEKQSRRQMLAVAADDDPLVVSQS